MYTTPASDGTDIRAYSEGSGPAILMLGPGTDDGTRTRKLGSKLSKDFHVLRLHRRQYRLDLKSGHGCSIEDEADDVISVAKDLGEPICLYGHSSGGIVALEAMVRAPQLFAGAVVFEAPVVTSMLRFDEGVGPRARALVARGRPGKAYELIAREIVELPGALAWVSGLLVALIPKYRRLVSAQIDDLDALIRLGDRVDAYADIEVPIVLLGGARSPRNVIARVDLLERALPNAERVVMPNRDHGADLKAPDEVARVIRALVDKASR